MRPRFDVRVLFGSVVTKAFGGRKLDKARAKSSGDTLKYQVLKGYTLDGLKDLIDSFPHAPLEQAYLTYKTRLPTVRARVKADHSHLFQSYLERLKAVLLVN